MAKEPTAAKNTKAKATEDAPKVKPAKAPKKAAAKDAAPKAPAKRSTKTAAAKTEATTKKAPAKATTKKATQTTPTKTASPKTTASTRKKAAPSPEASAPSAPAPAPVSPNGSRKTIRPAVSPIAEVTEAGLRALEQDDRDLPASYDETRIVALVRDPEWVFVYWEIDQEARKRHGIERGRHAHPLVLRIQEFSQDGGSFLYDVTVNDYTSSWYLKVKERTVRAQVSVGLYDKKRDFLAIATSREVRVPKMGISTQEDVRFADVDDETYQQIVQLSGGVRIGERLGSDEFLRSLQQRLYEGLTVGALSSAGLSSGALFGLSSGLFGGSSGHFSGSILPSSFAMFSGQFGPGGEETITAPLPRRVGQDFWLEVGVDVIVYGATQPDAKVTFMGREIPLTPDGTFRFRMVLPDTTVEFPVLAESADGKEKRTVKPVVRRNTEGDPRQPV